MKLTPCILLLVAIFSSCGKPVDIEGYVLSKHGVPVPKVTVELQLYKGSDYPDHDAMQVKTNSEGKFILHAHFRNNRGYKLFCSCDSGNATAGYLPSDRSLQVDLNLK